MMTIVHIHGTITRALTTAAALVTPIRIYDGIDRRSLSQVHEMGRHEALSGR